VTRIPGTWLAAAAILGAASDAAAQAPSATPPPAGARAAACSGAEFRQFDFWVGEWEVTSGHGQVAGVNRITPILRGCVLHEEWRGANGGSGQSFNMYDAATGKWRQTWVADNGVLLLLEGTLVAGSMVLTGRRPAPQKPGVTLLDRITWTPLELGDVRQLWEVSEDGGTSWRTVFDGRYAKRGRTGSP